MASIKVVKFDTIEEANHVLNGGIVGGAVLMGTTYIRGVVGQTLTFTTPAGNVTFTQDAADPPGLISFAKLKAQLEAAITTLRVVLLNSKTIAFKHATAGTAVTMGNSDEPTIKAALGFKNSTSIAGTAYAGPGGAAPKVASFEPDGNKIYYLLELP